jgi:hypothetical protein
MLDELIRANQKLDDALSKIDMDNPDVDEATSVMMGEVLSCLANIGELTPEEFIELFIKSNQISAFKKEVGKAMFMISQIKGVHEITKASSEW